MNRKPRLAWELYLKMETSGDSFSLLQLISNDCYKVFTKVISTLNHRYNILPQCRVKNLQISSNKVLPSMVGLVGPRYFGWSADAAPEQLSGVAKTNLTGKTKILSVRTIILHCYISCMPQCPLKHSQQNPKNINVAVLLTRFIMTKRNTS